MGHPVDLDPSSLVQIPTLPPSLTSGRAHSSGLAGQEAKDVKLPVSPPRPAHRTLNPLPTGQESVKRMGI
jgi:hypothetical protein